MAVKVGFISLFCRKGGARPLSSPPASWLWPSCRHSATHSFREEDGAEVSDGSGSSCFSTASEDDSAAEGVEAVVIRGLRSDRLFFEPDSTSSITAAAAARAESLPFEGSIAMEVESEDPYWDFRRSMEEMAVAHGLVDVQWLEEMLCWYLKMNEKRCHGIIVEAFLDLLLSLACSITPGMEDGEDDR
ncbi:Eukaryotic aspartyl protease [Musa troglodytarum]|uniref:Transcription repressor n=1 Tax=Musa troglodytarum TaxID=320322 RepID=A0A9E7I1H0_9LILI|nr:Eukaryotic aspartyl protease [Musa troglodytarum]